MSEVFISEEQFNKFHHWIRIASAKEHSVKYEKKKPFEKFKDQVSNSRRQGDLKQEYKLRGEMFKLLGNSAYGKTVTNIFKHETVKIVSEQVFAKNIRKCKTFEDLEDGFEMRFKKMVLQQDLPVQIGFAVYQLAKLRMLEFYYDFLDYYIDRSNYCLVQMDTDSFYISIAADTLDDLIKPHLKEHYHMNKHKWLGRADTEENILYDKREPGLFKEEYYGDGIIALSSKLYFCYGSNGDKFSSKGLNKKQNELTKERYFQALQGDDSQIFKNKGFRVKSNQMTTYTIEKKGLRLFNDKRKRIGFKTLPTQL